MSGVDAVTPADFRRPSRSRFLRGVKLTLVVAAPAWLPRNDPRPSAGGLCPFVGEWRK